MQTTGSRATRGRWRATGAVALVALAFALIGAGPAAAEPEPEPVDPVFVDGQAQPVFPTGSANWINHELWVETTVDSDFDGKLDRIHADVSRVRETDTTGLKVPVVYETSPYYGGNVNVVNWAVDHEIGFPPTTREVRFPTFGNTSPQISTAHEATWVPRGFAVVHAEGLGSGWSDGCTTSGAPNEHLGPMAVIDWLNGRAKGYTSRTGFDEVTAYWTTGKVGMIGTSYNGTLPIGVASTGVGGLEAIVPISAINSWYDYYRANGAVRAPGGFQGEDLDVLAEYTYTRRGATPAETAAHQQVCRPVLADIAAKQDRVTGDYSPFWDVRNYMNNIDKVKAASLVAHGNNDWNVMTKHAGTFYEAVKARGVPHQLYWHQGGHGGSPPLTQLNLWFTKYLWGIDNGVQNMPKAQLVREPDACPTRTYAVGVQPNVTNLRVDDSSPFTVGQTVLVQSLTAGGALSTNTRTIAAIPDARHLTLSAPVATGTGQRVGNGQLVYTCSTTVTTPYTEWPDPAAAPAKLNLTPGAPAAGGLTFKSSPGGSELLIDDATLSTNSLRDAVTSPNRLLFTTPVLTAPVRISGTPLLTLKVKFSKAKANLSAWLVSYPATGAGTVISRGWIDPENRNRPDVTDPITTGVSYEYRFDMQPKDSVIAVGRRLGLVVLSSDRDYTVRPAPGTELTLDLAASSITLPVVGGAQELAVAAATPAELLDRLSRLVGTLGLSPSLASELQTKIKGASRAADATAACAAVNSLLVAVLSGATRDNPRLGIAAAKQLLSANSILLSLGCQAAGSQQEAAEADLLDLSAAIASLDAQSTVSRSLGLYVKDASIEVVGGSPCATLAALKDRITHYVEGPHGGLTAEQAAPLTEALTHIAARLGCA